MGRQTFDLSQHSLFFIPSQYTQADFFPVATSFFAAEFSASFLERFHEAYSRTMEPVELTPQDDQDFRGRLLRELVEPDAVSELVFEGVLLNMLACARRGRKGRNGSPPSWLLRAKELLHDRAFESLKLYEIAKAVDVHPAQLSREFVRFFKATPGEYLRQPRIEFAAKQLEETNMELVQIAGASGFADQAHFSRAFHRRMRCSPGQYRNLLKAPV
jgi:AraC-like DNA-binding protein